ncbi:MFS transporter [Treponema brennaborense]|nr:MFS transporter [Treponema brennaborense]
MSVPIFFLFTIYGVVNAYLPLILRGMGYTVTQVGVLMGVFEVAGLVFPLLVGPAIEKKGNYGVPLLLLGGVMLLIPFPLVKIGGFWVSALCLAMYAIGYKGAVPLSDSLANALLGENRSEYGRVRVMGSIGFVIMTLVLQFFGNSQNGSDAEYILWMVIPALLFTVSLLIVPGLLTLNTASRAESVPETVRKPHLKDAFAAFPKRYWIGLALIFLGFFGLTPATRLFSLYASEFLHSNAAAALWALSAASEIPFMFFSGRFLKRYGSMTLIVFCTGTVVVRLLLYIVFPNMAGAVLGQMLNSITYGLYHPAAVLFATENAPKGKLMISMSMYSILAVGLANVLGNVIGGAVIDAFGYPALFVSFAAFPLAGVLFYSLMRKKLC